jgi:selenocysteine insertion sequence-binding protein 2
MKNAWDKKPSLVLPTRSDESKVSREAVSSLHYRKSHGVTQSSRPNNAAAIRSRSTVQDSHMRDKTYQKKLMSDSTLKSAKSITKLAGKSPQNLSNEQFPPLSTNLSGNQRQHSHDSQLKMNQFTSSENIPKAASMHSSPVVVVPSQKSVPKTISRKTKNIGHDTVSMHYTSSNLSKAATHKQYPKHTTDYSRPRSKNQTTETAPINSQQHIENMLHVPQGITSIVKGKQKVKRKKSLSTLKKAILKERLEQYRTSLGIGIDDSQNDQTTTEPPSSSILCLQDFVTADEVQEEDEYEEIVADLEALAKNIGPIQKVIIPRYGHLIGFAFVCFEAVSDALAAHACWKKMVLGGSELSTILIPNTTFENAQLIDDSYESVLLQISRETLLSLQSDVPNGFDSDGVILNETSGKQQCGIVHLDNILTAEDFEDEECLVESKDDIETLSKKYGKVLNIDIVMESQLKGRVSITFESIENAKIAADELNGMMIGGQTVVASLSSQNAKISVPNLILKGVLTDDDFDDDDCLEETKSDLMTLLNNFGKVETLEMEMEGNRKGDVKVTYDELSSVYVAIEELNGKMFGGAKLMTVLSEDASADTSLASSNLNHAFCTLNTNEAMVTASGKVIPAQYAEMKRVPKIPNKGVSRAYAKKMDNDQVVPILFEMLGELMRLQLRAKETNNTKVKRRLVLGLREVCRGIKSRKVKMVVLANNLDEYGALEEKLQEILDLANENEVPVISVLNKRKIGKAVGKNIKISVVGVENPEGAFESFKKLKRLCDK